MILNDESLKIWTGLARRDDWDKVFVGSDIRGFLAEIERLRDALEYYCCDAYGQCREVRLKDGSCIHADTGRCGKVAQDALLGKQA